MRFFTTTLLAALAATVAGLPTSGPADASPASAPRLQKRAAVGDPGIEARANTPADVKKHDENHAKQAKGQCGQGCKDSLASYHSQASKDAKASKSSKSKGGRDLADAEE